MDHPTEIQPSVFMVVLKGGVCACFPCTFSVVCAYFSCTFSVVCACIPCTFSVACACFRAHFLYCVHEKRANFLLYLHTSMHIFMLKVPSLGPKLVHHTLFKKNSEHKNCHYSGYCVKNVSTLGWFFFSFTIRNL